MSYEINHQGTERRRGPDVWLKLVNWVAISCWILMLGVLYLFDKAKPRTSTFFDRTANIPVDTSWDLGIVNNLLVLLATILGFCTIGLLVNSRRVKRRDDHYSVSLILLGIIAGLVIMAFLYYFRDIFGM
jgi:hypothetical protein